MLIPPTQSYTARDRGSRGRIRHEAGGRGDGRRADAHARGADAARAATRRAGRGARGAGRGCAFFCFFLRARAFALDASDAARAIDDDDDD